MKKTLINTCIAIGIIYLIYYLFFNNPIKFDNKLYEIKIDSLQKIVDSTTKQNDSLDTVILKIEKNTSLLIEKNSNLESKVSKLKNKRKKNYNIKYTPSQIDSFFKDRYPIKYLELSKDTTKIPIEVSKSIIVDLKESDINKDIIINQDTIINNLQLLTQNKDTIISDLKAKDYNNKFIIKNKSDQADNYVIQIGALREDTNKLNRKIKTNKIQRLILLAGIGFFILHK